MSRASYDPRIDDLAARFSTAMTDADPSTVASLFVADGTFWTANPDFPNGLLTTGRDDIAQLLVTLSKAYEITEHEIGEPTMTVHLEDHVLQAGIYTRTLRARDSGNQLHDRGTYVRLLTSAGGDLAYRSLVVSSLPQTP